MTQHGKQLKTYYWSTSHASGRGANVTDIFNSDIIESGSGINDHIPLDYKFDQTDLENINTLKNVQLGESIKLIVIKQDPDERATGLNRIYKWLINS